MDISAEVKLHANLSQTEQQLTATRVLRPTDDFQHYVQSVRTGWERYACVVSKSCLVQLDKRQQSKNGEWRESAISGLQITTLVYLNLITDQLTELEWYAVILLVTLIIILVQLSVTKTQSTDILIILHV